MRHVCSKQPVQLRESGKANGYRAQRASKEARATTTRHDKRFRAELGKQTWNNDALDHLFRAISLDLFPAHEHGFLGLVCHQGGKGQCCFQNKRTDRQRQRETERDRDRDRDRDRQRQTDRQTHTHTHKITHNHTHLTTKHKQQQEGCFEDVVKGNPTNQTEQKREGGTKREGIKPTGIEQQKRQCQARTLLVILP